MSTPDDLEKKKIYTNNHKVAFFLIAHKENFIAFKVTKSEKPWLVT